MPAVRRLLLLTADPALAAILPGQLAQGGEFEAEMTPPDLADERLAATPRPDAVLLDAALPPDPASWCARLAGRPVLLLGQGAGEASPFPLPPGAAGRATKPVRMKELVPQLHALLASFDTSPAAAIPVGPFAFHPAGRLLLGNGAQRIRLTEKEAAILLHLHQATGRAVSRDELLGEVWGYARSVTTHTLETHVYRLRRKLGTLPGGSELLRTEEGGYCLAGG
jgi:DNA-binding response OmpR family regulator